MQHAGILSQVRPSLYLYGCILALLIPNVLGTWSGIHGEDVLNELGHGYIELDYNADGCFDNDVKDDILRRVNMFKVQLGFNGDVYYGDVCFLGDSEGSYVENLLEHTGRIRIDSTETIYCLYDADDRVFGKTGFLMTQGPLMLVDHKAVFSTDCMTGHRRSGMFNQYCNANNEECVELSHSPGGVFITMDSAKHISWMGNIKGDIMNDPVSHVRLPLESACNVEHYYKNCNYTGYQDYTDFECRLPCANTSDIDMQDGHCRRVSATKVCSDFQASILISADNYEYKVLLYDNIVSDVVLEHETNIGIRAFWQAVTADKPCYTRVGTGFYAEFNDYGDISRVGISVGWFSVSSATSTEFLVVCEDLYTGHYFTICIIDGSYFIKSIPKPPFNAPRDLSQCELVKEGLTITDNPPSNTTFDSETVDLLREYMNEYTPDLVPRTRFLTTDGCKRDLNYKSWPELSRCNNDDILLKMGSVSIILSKFYPSDAGRFICSCNPCQNCTRELCFCTEYEREDVPSIICGSKNYGHEYGSNSLGCKYLGYKMEGSQGQGKMQDVIYVGEHAIINGTLFRNFTTYTSKSHQSVSFRDPIIKSPMQEYVGNLYVLPNDFRYKRIPYGMFWIPDFNNSDVRTVSRPQVIRGDCTIQLIYSTIGIDRNDTYNYCKTGFVYEHHNNYIVKQAIVSSGTVRNFKESWLFSAGNGFTRWWRSKFMIMSFYVENYGYTAGLSVGLTIFLVIMGIGSAISLCCVFHYLFRLCYRREIIRVDYVDFSNPNKLQGLHTNNKAILKAFEYLTMPNLMSSTFPMPSESVMGWYTYYIYNMFGNVFFFTNFWVWIVYISIGWLGRHITNGILKCLGHKKLNNFDVALHHIPFDAIAPFLNYLKACWEINGANASNYLERQILLRSSQNASKKVAMKKYLAQELAKDPELDQTAMLANIESVKGEDEVRSAVMKVINSTVRHEGELSDRFSTFCLMSMCIKAAQILRYEQEKGNYKLFNNIRDIENGVPNIVKGQSKFRERIDAGYVEICAKWVACAKQLSDGGEAISRGIKANDKIYLKRIPAASPNAAYTSAYVLVNMITPASTSPVEGIKIMAEQRDISPLIFALGAIALSIIVCILIYILRWMHKTSVKLDRICNTTEHSPKKTVKDEKEADKKRERVLDYAYENGNVVEEEYSRRTRTRNNNVYSDRDPGLTETHNYGRQPPRNKSRSEHTRSPDGEQYFHAGGRPHQAARPHHPTNTEIALNSYSGLSLMSVVILLFSIFSVCSGECLSFNQLKKDKFNQVIDMPGLFDAESCYDNFRFYNPDEHMRELNNADRANNYGADPQGTIVSDIDISYRADCVRTTEEFKCTTTLQFTQELAMIDGVCQTVKLTANNLDTNDIANVEHHGTICTTEAFVKAKCQHLWSANDEIAYVSDSVHDWNEMYYSRQRCIQTCEGNCNCMSFNLADGSSKHMGLNSGYQEGSYCWKQSGYNNLVASYSVRELQSSRFVENCRVDNVEPTVTVEVIFPTLGINFTNTMHQLQSKDCSQTDDMCLTLSGLNIPHDLEGETVLCGFDYTNEMFSEECYLQAGPITNTPANFFHKQNYFSNVAKHGFGASYLGEVSTNHITGQNDRVDWAGLEDNKIHKSQLMNILAPLSTAIGGDSYLYMIKGEEVREVDGGNFCGGMTSCGKSKLFPENGDCAEEKKGDYCLGDCQNKAAIFDKIYPVLQMRIDSPNKAKFKILFNVKGSYIVSTLFDSADLTGCSCSLTGIYGVVGGATLTINPGITSIGFLPTITQTNINFQPGQINLPLKNEARGSYTESDTKPYMTFSIDGTATTMECDNDDMKFKPDDQGKDNISDDTAKQLGGEIGEILTIIACTVGGLVAVGLSIAACCLCAKMGCGLCCIACFGFLCGCCKCGGDKKQTIQLEEMPRKDEETFVNKQPKRGVYNEGYLKEDISNMNRIP